jgi:ribosomal protein L7Ae-like RNA K-turn-binding protein
MDTKAPDRFLGLLGLAKRAGRTVTGAPLIFTAMRTKRPPCLVLVAEDASDGAKKKLRTKCEFYKIESHMLPIGAGDLGHAVGKLSAIGAVAITDKSLCEMIKKTLNDSAATESNHNDHTKGTLVEEAIEVRRE